MSKVVPNLTAWVLVAVVIAIGIYDVYVASKGTLSHTVSAYLLLIGRDYPILVFLMGALFGHVFWPHVPASAIEREVKSHAQPINQTQAEPITVPVK